MVSGERVRAARKARGLTLVELASRARLSYSYLSEIERGAKTPSLDALTRLADALNLNKSELVEMSEEEGAQGIGLGDKLRLAREDRGMTLREVASAAGISSTYLSEIERGNVQPAVSVLKQLARVLHVPLSTFMSPAERKGFLGEKLRRLREKLGMTQAEVAAKAGVSAALIGQIELGRVSPSLKTINKIASALGVSPCYLVLDSEGIDELIPAMSKELRDLLQDPNVQMLLSAVCTLNEREMRFIFEIIALLKRSGLGRA
ncbi:MAG: helix-turn-helix transcriptional regulator [Firmicutes bacterium]|nr:helix-turn-helix transcriptional regulator [Bacillota bacterium]